MVAYDHVAEEYYDSDLHPTCSNFRFASELFVREIQPETLFRGDVLELGAGDSLVAKLARDGTTAPDHLMITDASARMLAYSQQYAGDNVVLERVDAARLPFRDASFDVVVSFLGDPYNLPKVWLEVRRVIRPGGTVIFTTPASEWAHSFRRSKTIDAAEFLLRNRQTVFVPSYVHGSDEQSALFSSCGFHVRHHRKILRDEIPEDRLSPKLLQSTSVVDGFLLDA